MSKIRTRALPLRQVIAERKAKLSGVQASSSTNKSKLAERIAQQIESRIVVEGWPVGHPLGKEADWTEAMQVSRWTVREALALLEQTGVVESRRGRSGGLFVAASMLDAVRNGLSNYLEFVRIQPADVRQVRRALERTMIEAASARIDDAGRQRIAGLIETATQPIGPASLEATAAIRQALLKASDNPALELFLSGLSQAMLHASWYSSLDDPSFGRLIDAMVLSTCRTAEAVIQGKPGIALDAEDQFLSYFERLYGASALSAHTLSRPRSVERADRLFPAGRPAKKPEQLARNIRLLIIESGWPVGRSLGSEADLMARYGVGRAVLREAIRSLERLGVVAMGRGGRSGLRVISPDPVQIVAACQRYLRRSGMTAQHAEMARSALRSAVSRPTDGQRETAPANQLADLFLQILN